MLRLYPAAWAAILRGDVVLSDGLTAWPTLAAFAAVESHTTLSDVPSGEYVATPIAVPVASISDARADLTLSHAPAPSSGSESFGLLLTGGASDSLLIACEGESFRYQPRPGCRLAWHAPIQFSPLNRGTYDTGIAQILRREIVLGTTPQWVQAYGSAYAYEQSQATLGAIPGLVGNPAQLSGLQIHGDGSVTASNVVLDGLTEPAGGVVWYADKGGGDLVPIARVPHGSTLFTAPASIELLSAAAGLLRVLAWA